MFQKAKQTIEMGKAGKLQRHLAVQFSVEPRPPETTCPTSSGNLVDHYQDAEWNWYYRRFKLLI